MYLHSVTGVTGVTIIPASPGWHVLAPRLDDERRAVGFDRLAVIAWRVDLTAEGGDRVQEHVRPVVLESISAPKDPLLERPDGIILDPDPDCGHLHFSTEAEALEYWTERERWDAMSHEEQGRAMGLLPSEEES